jgi:hypothetical protein
VAAADPADCCTISYNGLLWEYEAFFVRTDCGVDVIDFLIQDTGPGVKEAQR